MNLQGCYDVFNDYLGLSTVVGGQEDQCYWMRSVLGRDYKKFQNIPSLDHQFSESHLDMNAYYDSKLSDVERLFGRGAVLQKSINEDSEPATNNYQVPVLENLTPPTTNQAAYPVSGKEDYKDRIQIALDAILQKYSHLQNPCLTSSQFAGNFQDRYTTSNTIPPANQLNQQYGIEDRKTLTNLDLDSNNRILRVTRAAKSGLGSCATRFIGCSFCKNNKEVKDWYMSHQLKDSTGKVTCPVLRSYECPLCDATGDNAHTIGHCSLNPNRHSSLPLAVRSKTNATGKKKSL